MADKKDEPSYIDIFMQAAETRRVEDAALGLFVDQFAIVEGLAYELLCFVSGVPGNVGKAIFSGVRTTVIISQVRRIFRVSSFDPAFVSEIEEIFSHLTPITDLRNDILHFGLESGEESLVVSKAFKALPGADPKTRPVSVEILRSLVRDLVKMQCHLILLIWKDRLPQEYADLLGPARLEPWQYKPPEQEPKGRKTRSGPHKPKPPQESSHE